MRQTPRITSSAALLTAAVALLAPSGVWASPAGAGVDPELPPHVETTPAPVYEHHAYVPGPPPPPAPAGDPARTRLLLSRSADTLEAGEVEFTCQALLGTRFALGASDWLELSVTATPLLAMAWEPELSYWAADLRVSLVDHEVVDLTAEAGGVALFGMVGLRAGLAARLGTDQFSAHGNLSYFRMRITDNIFMEDCGYEDGTCDQEGHALVASAGFSARLSSKVQLLGELTYYRDAGMDMIIASPGVRLHGHHFATDLGFMVIRSALSDDYLALPLVNFSVNY